MKQALICFLLIFAIVLTGCSSLFPKGDKGDKGDPGTTLLKVYSGYFYSTSLDLSVPEILYKEDTTFVLVYYSLNYGTTWYPISDGWLDNPAYACYYSISWDLGRIHFSGVSSGDKYRVEVYEHN